MLLVVYHGDIQRLVIITLTWVIFMFYDYMNYLMVAIIVTLLCIIIPISYYDYGY